MPYRKSAEIEIIYKPNKSNIIALMFLIIIVLSSTPAWLASFGILSTIWYPFHIFTFIWFNFVIETIFDDETDIRLFYKEKRFKQ